MTALSSKSLLLCLLIAMLSLSSHVTKICARRAPASASVPTDSDKKQTECIEGGEGTVLIPGIGRTVAGSHELPSVGGLDHSGPAAANGQYIPGADDTFVPNPGFEVPNPFHGSVP